MKIKPYSIIGFCIIVLAVLSACSDRTEKDRVSVEDKQLGLHCLESDGTHRGLIRQVVVVRSMNPDTFEHYFTRIMPVDVNGMHELYMTYDGFDSKGKEVGGEVIASVKNDNCAATIISSIPFTGN